MASEAIVFDKPGIPRPLGWFRLDVILTVASDVSFIDWDTEYWGMHPSRQPFTHEVGDLLSYLALDSQLETFQLPRVADSVKPGLLDQLTVIPGLEFLPKDVSEVPDREAPLYEMAAWLGWMMGEYPMDRLVELSPVIMDDYQRINAATEWELMGGAVVGLEKDDEE